jgi:metal-responsive CopG/Arc/MetJ family transcriptional regulator
MKYIIKMEYCSITMGRPQSRDKLAETIHIKLPESIKEQLDQEAKARGFNMSQLIRTILMEYTEFLQVKDRDSQIMTLNEPTMTYKTHKDTVEEYLTSDEFRELLRKEVQLALKKLIQ